MKPSAETEFEDGLAQAAREVEARLELHLARLGETGAPSRLLSAMSHAVLGGGKRFRPFLVLETARLAGGPGARTRALDVAAALECVHAYSLVHDDLPAMDNDELRRGQPTVWKAFDEWTAILAGDALLTFAFEILAHAARLPDGPLTAAQSNQLIARLAIASGPVGMVGGQMLDLEAEKMGEPRAPDEAHVRRLQGMKTGALITFAVEAGAVVADAPPEVLSAARSYGEAIGLAFQISDDLLDVTGEAATVGKAVGKDLALGKATLVAIAGPDEAQGHLHRAVARAIAALGGFGDAADPLRAAARFQLSRRR